MEIETNIKDLNTLNECLQLLYKYGINEDTINIVIKKILELTELLGKTEYSFNIKAPKSAQFVPSYNEIILSKPKLDKWIDNNIYNEQTKVFPNIQKRELLKCYMILNILIHEIEHAKQYLIGKEELPSPSLYLTKGYYNITNLLINPNYILPRPIKTTRRITSLSLYLSNCNMYVLERNANLESFLTTGSLAIQNEDYLIATELIKAAILYMRHGYKTDMGSLYETHKKILLLDKLPKIDDYKDLDAETKIRYGLPIKKEDRKKIFG